jgi:hypothetical protein
MVDFQKDNPSVSNVKDELVKKKKKTSSSKTNLERFLYKSKKGRTKIEL